MILFDTLMGKGVPFLEQREKNHFIRVDPPEWQQALQIAGAEARAVEQLDRLNARERDAREV